MNSENIKSIIILKGLPSNFIDEAIFVLTHKKAGSQPNIIAITGPVTGPAPAIDEN